MPAAKRLMRGRARLGNRYRLPDMALVQRCDVLAVDLDVVPAAIHGQRALSRTVLHAADEPQRLVDVQGIRVPRPLRLPQADDPLRFHRNQLLSVACALLVSQGLVAPNTSHGA